MIKCSIKKMEMHFYETIENNSVNGIIKGVIINDGYLEKNYYTQIILC